MYVNNRKHYYYTCMGCIYYTLLYKYIIKTKRIIRMQQARLNNCFYHVSHCNAMS